MSLYENQKCPVCGVPFKSGDDIVTCPECGTPHHRKCYEKIGKCVNSELHNTGFTYKKDQDKTAVQPEYQGNAAQDSPYYIPHSHTQQSDQQTTPGGQQNQKSEYTHIPMRPSRQTGDKAAFVFKNDEKIEGYLLSDIVTVVGANFFKFVTKFKKNKKVGWNWSAFIFGPYYLFFRKMYGPGTLFIVLEFIARFIISLVFSKQLTSFTNGFMSLVQDQSITYPEYYSKLTSLVESSGVATAYAILTAVLVAVHILIAVIVDRLYKNKVFSVISSVDKKLEEGSAIALSPLAMQGDSQMSPSEIRNLFLASRGGVSFFAPCIAYLALSLVTDLIAYI